MTRRNAPLQATLDVLHDAGFDPTIEHSGTGHFKVRAGPDICIVVAGSSSDWRAAVQARSIARRIVRTGKS